ncbi:MAG: DUF2877 domain-containing protein [Nitrososphaeraceae archaeon]
MNHQPNTSGEVIPIGEGNDDMVDFECEYVGVLHKYILNSSSKKDTLGKVISSFPSSLNIKTSRNELLVISLNKTQSPITINLTPQCSNTDFAGLVEYGYDVNKSRDSVSIGEKMILHTAKSKVFKNCFVRPTYAGLNEFSDAAEKILCSLRESRRSGCLLEPEITNQGLLDQFIADISEYGIGNEDNNGFVRKLSHSLIKMCGRGPGFTPSGDDFICGFSALFNWLSQSRKRPPVSLPIKRVCNLTTWISFKFIEYYQNLIVDEQIQGLINSIGERRPDRFMSLLTTLSRRGHTSGLDIGTGLIIALFIYSDRFVGTELLPKVQSFLEKGN